jgi:Putative peptidoglycan binding domain
MARFFAGRVLPAKRVVVVAVAVVAVAGVAAGVAVAGSGGRGGGASPAGGGGVATAAVVRTTLVNSVQVGGSIGFDGSYTVAAPSGVSPAQVASAQQAVTEDEQALSADEQAGSDALAADGQQVSADEANVSADRSGLAADRVSKRKACSGAGGSSAACSQAGQKVSQDQAALTQARQQLAQARAAAKTDGDTGQARVAADRTRLAGDRAALAALRPAETSAGTTYTWLPQPGQVIRQDQRMYAVSNVPVPLLYGTVAAYRAFYAGMSDGADVGELTRDLIALGFGAGLTRSDHYSAATAAAVGRWQRKLGLPVTGRILLGQVVFEPGPIRVASVTPSAGSAAGGGGAASAGGGGGGGTVLTATSTTPVVTLDLGVSQEYLVKPGDAVSVVLPDGTSTVGGKVQSVGTVASCPGGGSTGTGTGTGSSGTGGGSGSPCASAGSNGGAGSNSSPTVTVTITLDHTPAGAALDQAPVNVNITSQRAANVLAVPVDALLALAGGGFGVQVVTGDTSHLAGVTTGLYSATMVQVSGPALTAGMRVEVPAQ